MSLGKRKKPAAVAAQAHDEGGERDTLTAAQRKGAKGAAPGGAGGSFGDVLQKALQRKLPKGSAGPAVGSGAKGNVELKKRIKEDKVAREEKKMLVEKRKWFQKEHVVPVRGPALGAASRAPTPAPRAGPWSGQSQRRAPRAAVAGLQRLPGGSGATRGAPPPPGDTAGRQIWQEEA